MSTNLAVLVVLQKGFQLGNIGIEILLVVDAGLVGHRPAVGYNHAVVHDPVPVLTCRSREGVTQGSRRVTQGVIKGSITSPEGIISGPARVTLEPRRGL
jgi:hypothetical protein